MVETKPLTSHARELVEEVVEGSSVVAGTQVEGFRSDAAGWSKYKLRRGGRRVRRGGGMWDRTYVACCAK